MKLSQHMSGVINLSSWKSKSNSYNYGAEGRAYKHNSILDTTTSRKSIKLKVGEKLRIKCLLSHWK